MPGPDFWLQPSPNTDPKRQQVRAIVTRFLLPQETPWAEFPVLTSGPGPFLAIMGIWGKKKKKTADGSPLFAPPKFLNTFYKKDNDSVGRSRMDPS